MMSYFYLFPVFTRKASPFVLVLLLLLNTALFAQKLGEDRIPEKPSPERLVNDYVPILSSSQIQELETRLDAFADSTDVQIAVVIVPMLSDYDIADYAQRLGQKWGVGGAKFSNGLVVVVKPKTVSEKGEAFIATGYGVEALVPDATAWDIVNNEMIPHFRQNDYYGGIDAAVTVLIKLTTGEFKADTYGKSQGQGGSVALVIIIIVIIVIFMLIGNNSKRHHGMGSGNKRYPVFWPSGGSSGGSWGRFSGGGGGGFGGFGGGSFGGGGSGGSW